MFESIEDCQAGEEMFDSYGKKCNSRFLINYGFIEDDNDGNEVPFKIYLHEENTQLYGEKLKLLNYKKELI
jgi:hypothetical protein